jgi:hypothetical protein
LLERDGKLVISVIFQEFFKVLGLVSSRDHKLVDH